MAIADKIENIKTHLGEAYASLEEKGATIPQNKNIENLADSILTISGGDVPSRLPKEYQEVEYIESTGTQYINTNFYPDSNTKIQMKFMNLARSDYAIIGYYVNDSNCFRFFNYAYDTYLDFGSSSNRINSTTKTNANTIYEYELANRYIKNIETGAFIKEGTKVTFNQKNTPIYLNGNSSYSKNRWYYVKIYDNEVLAKDLVPCYRKSDDVIGMYDLANNEFLINNGTGVFLKGKDVVTEKYEEKEIEITENGVNEILPSEGYKSMSKVTVTTNVGGSIEEYFTLYPQTAAPSSQSNGLKNYVKRVPKLNLSSATSMAYLYANMPLVEEIDCSFDTTTIKDMQYCFYADTNLKNIKGIENWNTSNVTNMSYMLYNCYNIKDSLDLKKWNTSNVTAMSFIFSGISKNISKGIEIDLSTWDTSKVTTMNNFIGATTSSNTPKIKSIKFSQNFGEACTNFNNFFAFVSAETPLQLDLSMWNVSNATSMTQMFRGFTKLSVLDISSFDFTNVTSYSQIFNSCGTSATTDTGAYADGKPYIYVKDTAAQQWILNLTGTARPSNWTANNVIIAGSEQDLRGA